MILADMGRIADTCGRPWGRIQWFRGAGRSRIACLIVPLAATALGGCTGGVLDPHGAVGSAEKLILLNCLTIMLAIVVPIIIATIVFAWWFRSTNKKARYLPEWSFSGKIELIIWSVPAMIVMLLGGIGWTASHDLDPAKPLKSSVEPLDVEVVSLDWKWLFIYPKLGISTVNQLVVPAGVPIRFRLTSDSVWNSFFIPQLGSQIYTMAGMTTKLNLVADRPGVYPGLSSHFSGSGFSDMRFDVSALPPEGFKAWVLRTKSVGPSLTPSSYASLARPSEAVRPFSYRDTTPRLFESILSRATSSTPLPSGLQSTPPHINIQNTRGN